MKTSASQESHQKFYFLISLFCKADGTPVSVRKFKAMFEQDRHCAERARETGTLHVLYIYM